MVFHNGQNAFDYMHHLGCDAQIHRIHSGIYQMERNESSLILWKFNIKTALDDLQRILCDQEFMIIKPMNFL